MTSIRGFLVELAAIAGQFAVLAALALCTSGAPLAALRSRSLGRLAGAFGSGAFN
jgi:hypothetical protein